MTTLFVLLQAAASGVAIAKFGAALGGAIAAMAAASGIGKIGDSALRSIARQPESSGDIRTSMIIAAALIEGVCFFAIIVCVLAIFM